jgi:hypothetical protein
MTHDLLNDTGHNLVTGRHSLTVLIPALIAVLFLVTIIVTLGGTVRHHKRLLLYIQ